MPIFRVFKYGDAIIILGCGFAGARYPKIRWYALLPATDPTPKVLKPHYSFVLEP